MYITGVEILAIVNSKERADHIVLVTQFRPPTGKKVLEFPAGITIYVFISLAVIYFLYCILFINNQLICNQVSLIQMKPLSRRHCVS